MKSEILEINEINDDECSITYKVLKKRKKVVYKKNSKKLLSCINKYLNDLDSKQNKLLNKNDNQTLTKQLLSYIIVIPIVLFIVYLILNTSLNTISYIFSLLLITCSFLLINLFNYKSNLVLENEYKILEKEISLINNVKNNCLLYKKSS